MENTIFFRGLVVYVWHDNDFTFTFVHLLSLSSICVFSFILLLLQLDPTRNKNTASIFSISPSFVFRVFQGNLILFSSCIGDWKPWEADSVAAVASPNPESAYGTNLVLGAEIEGNGEAW